MRSVYTRSKDNLDEEDEGDSFFKTLATSELKADMLKVIRA